MSRMKTTHLKAFTTEPTENTEGRKLIAKQTMEGDMPELPQSHTKPDSVLVSVSPFVLSVGSVVNVFPSFVFRFSAFFRPSIGTAPCV